MKDFSRTNLLFSLCGLNCGLCPMNVNQYCPGCGGGQGNQSCSIAKCSLQHGNVQYCFRCDRYPCEKYDHIDEWDSFITHRNQKSDLEKCRTLGDALYCEEQQKKQEVLHLLLEQYNDGRKKTLFCAAVNLLDWEALEGAMDELAKQAAGLPLKERSACAAALLERAAADKGISLKLRKKKPAPK